MCVVRLKARIYSSHIKHISRICYAWYGWYASANILQILLRWSRVSRVMLAYLLHWYACISKFFEIHAYHVKLFCEKSIPKLLKRWIYLKICTLLFEISNLCIIVSLICSLFHCSHFKTADMELEMESSTQHSRGKARQPSQISVPVDISKNILRVVASRTQQC